MQDVASLKSRVRDHWEAEACGTRYGQKADRKLYFERISEARYTLEPYIPAFADFAGVAGKTVLEIGVGAGADFQNWCEHAAHTTGVDLTERAIALTKERLDLNNISDSRYTLRTADAEGLPFPDNTFDQVYSWGVLHHTPDTERAFREVFRVLKPGGRAKAMIYHVPSWTGALLYLQHGLARGNIKVSLKDVIYDHLESPGTKAYTITEASEFLCNVGFTDISLATKLGPGDLLTIKPSKKYDTPIHKLIWRIYPRWLVRLLGDRYGLYLLVEATKPLTAS